MFDLLDVVKFTEKSKNKDRLGMVIKKLPDGTVLIVGVDGKLLTFGSNFKYVVAVTEDMYDFIEKVHDNENLRLKIITSG